MAERERERQRLIQLQNTTKVALVPHLEGLDRGLLKCFQMWNKGRNLFPLFFTTLFFPGGRQHFHRRNSTHFLTSITLLTQYLSVRLPVVILSLQVFIGAVV